MKPTDYWQLRRNGFDLMSSVEMEVLKTLLQAKKDGWEFIALEGVHKRTLNALFRKDWIFTSGGAEGVVHKITARGEKAVQIYSAPSIKRDDGLCPRCGENQRQVTPSGKVKPYCKTCESRMNSRNYVLKRPTAKIGRMCSRCHKRPVLVRASGRVITYCHHCNLILKRREKKRLRRRKAREMQSGIVFTCTKPGCTNPRYCMPNTLSDWCYEHYREFQNEYLRRKKRERMVSIIEGLK